jgi:medium-chain acyl-[acyl-carrier-protein] hydrolase
MLSSIILDRAHDRMSLDRWVPFRTEGVEVRCRLFSFPHAAGSAAFYGRLRRAMPPQIDLCPVELPGRAARLDESPFTSMNALLEQLGPALQPLMTVPFGFFGHSVGALIAFEAARRLHALDGRSALHLFVSSRGAPRCPADACTARARSDDDLLDILNRFGGTPTAVLQRPELLATVLHVLRADLALADGYAFERGDRIACPVTAFGGADDRTYSNALDSWSNVTREKFRTFIFPGGHFYFSPAAEALADEMIGDLRASVDMHGAAFRSQI